MRYYSYVEPDDYGNCIINVISEKQILEEYWDYWSNNMKRVNKDHQICEENCIYDFCVIHWAIETDENGDAL